LFSPDHDHALVEAGGTKELIFRIRRGPDSQDQFMRLPEVVINADVLMPGHRYSMPEQRTAIPLNIDQFPVPAAASPDLAVLLDGDDALRFGRPLVAIPDGPFTVECWINADEFASRVGVISRAESSEFGLFANGGRPHFSVHLDGKYAEAQASTTLKPGSWHHLAGVFDGQEVRMYVDGKLEDRAAGKGKRTANKLPLYIGADTDGDGRAVSFFKGRVDSVRVSDRALYTGQSFTPERRPGTADGTLLLLNMDAMFGLSAWNESPEGRKAPAGDAVGTPVLVPAE